MKPLSTLIVFAALAGCGSDVVPTSDDVRPVRAEQVAAQRGAVAVRYAGEVRARHETPLAFRVGGRVTRRAVDVGATIAAGQLIATLDPQDYALALQAAQAQLAAAEADARLAQQDLQRFSELHARNFIAEAELDRRRATADAAQARVRQLRADVARQGNQQAYARLSAPHAGVVTDIALEPGQVVAAGQTVAQLARMGELEVRIDVAENALDTLRAADALTVRLWSTPDKTYAGRLRELSPAADPVSRTYGARVSVLAADAAVKLGMSATVEAARTAELGLSVAQSALFQGDGRPQVWVVDVARGTVAARDVRLGALVGERASVVAGLKPGEWVVTAGVHKLAPGQKVRLTP